MQLSDELALSVYRPVAEISAKHHVQLVQHTETGKFYVKKQLTVYSAEVFRSLIRKPVKHVPQIFALFEDTGTLTVIEEYLPGSSLAELLEQDGPCPEEQAANLVLQLTRIVSALHHRTPAIIHRDIKPSNLILSPDGILELLDFNAAKFSSPDEYRDTRLLGTTGYAAPEQYGFGVSSPQTDLYAIGVLFHELLTGRMPSAGSGNEDVGRFSSIIKRCTKLDPADRFASADELSEAILLVMNSSDTVRSAVQDSSTDTSQNFQKAGQSFSTDDSSHPMRGASSVSHRNDTPPYATTGDSVGGNQGTPSDSSCNINQGVLADNPRSVAQDSFSAITYASSSRRFLPPGFRRGDPARMIPSTFGYLFLFYFGFTLQVDDAVSQLDLILNRIDFTLTMFTVVFFSANYLGVQRLFPLARSKNKLAHIIGVILWDIIFVFALLMLLSIAESFL
ncbi:MAG: serine/threonine protein kinase [Lachnospiraceae bacterium]|nr:serine/threonine protein kinase [Lachnospiraceae bacterium]